MEIPRDTDLNWMQVGFGGSNSEHWEFTRLKVTYLGVLKELSGALPSIAFTHKREHFQEPDFCII